MNKIKVLSLFSGIGAFETGLKKANIPFELVNYCEIDKYASKSYSLVHDEPETKNLWDVTKIDVTKLPGDIDLITHGSPCQDFSLAGKQAGGDEGSGTRSSLMYETIKIVKHIRPKYILWENVKNLLSKKHRHNFDAYLQTLEDLGYVNFYQVLNAKNYGIPQNRERVFTISIRKDLNKNFEFPKPFELKLRLKDMLEKEVDEKYYLSDKMIKYISASGTKNFKNPDCKINLDVARPLTTDPNKRAGTTNYISEELPDNYDLKEIDKKIVVVGNYSPSGHNASRIVHPEGVAPTVMENHGTVTAVIVNESKEEKSLFTETQAKMITPEGDVKRYINSDIVDEFKEGQCADISFPNGYNKGPRVHDECPAINTTTTQASFIVKVKDKTEKELSLNTEYKKLIDTIEKNDMPIGEVKHIDLYNRKLTDNCGTLTDPCHNNNRLWDGLRIRKLTPKECWRLMGFDDESFDKVNGILSNTQLYKQAGNSIVVDVLKYIYIELFKDRNVETKEVLKQQTIFDFISEEKQHVDTESK